MNKTPESARFPVVRFRFDSHFIAEATYDENIRALDVRYHDGKAYRHYDVEVSAWAALLTAESPGRHFADKIREKYLRAALPTDTV